MTDSSSIAVVIPAYKVSDTIEEVVQALPDIVDYIIVVDDKCPHSSGEKTEKIDRKNLILLYHDTNQGVGGAVITGYKKALELGCDIIIKIDGDGQMDPKYNLAKAKSERAFQQSQ